MKRYRLTVKVLSSRASGAVNYPEKIGKIKEITFDTNSDLKKGDTIEETIKVSDWNPILTNQCEILNILSEE